MYWRNTLPFFDSDMAEFVCRKCGWRGYELTTIKTDKQGNELPINEWYRGCPHCKSDMKHIELED